MAPRTAPPPLPSNESMRERYLRRSITIPIYFVLCALCIVAAPLLVPLLALLGLFRGGRRFPALRIYLMLTVYLVCETGGILEAWMINVRRLDPDTRFRANFHLQNRWANGLLRAGRRIFSVNLVIEGQEIAGPGPIIVYSRHVSIADTLLPVHLVDVPHDLHLRYVLKRMFLWDPCIDTVGNRIPNQFVRKGSGDTAREVAGVVRLLDGLDEHSGVLIFPEGGLINPETRERIVEHLRKRGDTRAYERARQYRHLAPPRAGGPLALLENNPGADIVLLGHVGFEGATSPGELWRGALIGRTVRVRLERIPFDQVPTDPAEQPAWLHDQWLRVDRWVDSHHHDDPGASLERTTDRE